MTNDKKRTNGIVAKILMGCLGIIFILRILDYAGLFTFDPMLINVITYAGAFAFLSPIILYKLNIPDDFLKYYMFVGLSLFIGAMGCFNSIGIYITFVLVPVASCIYIDSYFTINCSIISYVIMVIAVYINAAGKYEVTLLGKDRFYIFLAYISGFTIEYLLVAIFLALIMKMARNMLVTQQAALTELRAKDASLDLLIKGTKDIVFEYNVSEGYYVANRSIYQDCDCNNVEIKIDDLKKESDKNPGMLFLLEKFNEGIQLGHFDEFEADMSYEKDGKNIPLWFNVECFVVEDRNSSLSVIGKMHDITRSKTIQESAKGDSFAKMYYNSKKKNSLFEQVMQESVHYTDEDYEKLSEGHSFIARTMNDMKYASNLVEGVNGILAEIGSHFGFDRICIIEGDMSSGVCTVNYQWNSKEENTLTDYFTYMSIEDINDTMKVYDEYGYIEVNPASNINRVNLMNADFTNMAIYSVILGNQIWIPMISNGNYDGAICFDRYDTSPYSSVEKFLLSEAVNSITNIVNKINAEKSNKAKSDFLSTMSHEIRTPMNAIVGMTEVALREEMSDSVKKSLMMVKSSAFGLLTLINDILDYSKIEAGRFEIIKDSFQTLALLNDVKEITTARNNGKLKLEFDVPSDLPTVLNGDVVRIKQVMINFCTNAIKYSEKGTVTIRTSVEQKSGKGILKFSVSDNGIGIKKEDLSKLFKSYTRVDTSVNHHKEGTGLGLAISKQLVELMDGSVGVESEYGVGSTFSFYIPIDIVDGKPAGRLEDYKYDEEDIKPQIEIVLAPSAKVLIVDDSEINLLVAEALMEPTLMNIDTVDNGEEAVKMISMNDYDLVFMDHFMPGLDGVETTELIRGLDNEKSNVPIIALTADAMDGVREELIAKGMNDFLTKPIIVGDLYRIIKQWIPKEKIEN